MSNRLCRGSNHLFRVNSLLLAALFLAPFATQAQTAHLAYSIGATLGSGFSSDRGVAADINGNVYIADTQNNAVKEMPAGCFSASCVLSLGAGFNSPWGVAVDSNGNVYVADTYNGAVEEMTPGCASSSCVTPLGGGGFPAPTGVAVDTKGNVYVVSYSGNSVYEMSPNCASSSCVTTLGGTFSAPLGVSVDASGNAYVADTNDNAVKKIPSGCTQNNYLANLCTVTTLGAGFSSPSGTAVDSSGNIYVSDESHNAVKEMPSSCASSTCVTTLGAVYEIPGGIAVDPNGDVFVADTGHSAVGEIRMKGVNPVSAQVLSSFTLYLTFKFDTGGTIIRAGVLDQGQPDLDFADANTGTCPTGENTGTYTAGETCTVNITFTPAYSGVRYAAVDLVSNNTDAAIATAFLYGTGIAPQAVFSPSAASTLGGGFFGPSSVAVDESGLIYVADQDNGLVKQMYSNCTNENCVGTLGGGFSYPGSVAIDGNGYVYVADGGNQAVKMMWRYCASSSCVTTLGGGFNHPWAVAVDGNGNVYVADWGAGKVDEMPPGCASASCVTSIGGSFNGPIGISVDSSGNVFVADAGAQVVKQIPPGCVSSSCVLSLGGGFYTPENVALDGNGNIYVTDYGYNYASSVKVMPPGCASSACVTTLAGGLNYPIGEAVDGSGNVYITDASSNVVQEFLRTTPPSLAFAATPINWVSAPQDVIVQNIGNMPLDFPQPSSAGNNPSLPANFLWDSSSTCKQTDSASPDAYSLSAGAFCIAAIDFAPTAVAGYGGSLIFTDNTLNAKSPAYATQSAQLNGTGVLPPPAATPTFSPAPGDYPATQLVTITTATPDSTIYYTLDGHGPSIHSTLYTGPILISSTQTLNAIAVAKNYAGSAIASGQYTILRATCCSPIGSHPALPASAPR